MYQIKLIKKLHDWFILFNNEFFEGKLDTPVINIITVYNKGFNQVTFTVPCSDDEFIHWAVCCFCLIHGKSPIENIMLTSSVYFVIFEIVNFLFNISSHLIIPFTLRVRYDNTRICHAPCMRPNATLTLPEQ